MKLARMILTYTVLIAALYGYHNYLEIPAVPPVRVVAPTERSIREDIRHEQRFRQYKSASLAASKVYRKNGCKSGLADLTGRVAVEEGVSARVLAALVFVESSCNPNAVSRRDGIGLTQVNSRVWRYSTAELKNPNRNLEIGAKILASYVRRHGLKEGLHAYNGFGNHTDEYSTKVLMAAGILVS